MPRGAAIVNADAPRMDSPRAHPTPALIAALACRRDHAATAAPAPDEPVETVRGRAGRPAQFRTRAPPYRF